MMNTLYVTPISMVEAKIYMPPPFLVVFPWYLPMVDRAEKFPYANPMTNSLRLKLM
jgi:hypothetical protein